MVPQSTSLLYPFCSVISTLQSLLVQPGFLHLYEQLHENLVSDPSVVRNVYDGKLWQEFMVVSGIPFLVQLSFPA